MNYNQAANLKGFLASMNPRFHGGIPDFMDGILDLWTNSIHFNVLHRNIHWRNPMLKSLNSMPDNVQSIFYCVGDQ